MPGVEQKTTTETSTITTKWWVGLLTPQTVVMLLAGFASLVLFWNTQKNHSNQIDALNRMLQQKAEQSDLKAIDDKVNRQYEQIRTVLERIIVVEKAAEYQRGKNDAFRDQKNE
jgi:hypothetical protein